MAAAIDCQGRPTVAAVEGRVFHSLPLPIKTGLPVHINAAVNLSSNRRSVCDEDDSRGAWNRALFSGLVRVCYESLLQTAAETLVHPSVHALLPFAALGPWAHHVQVCEVICARCYVLCVRCYA